MKKEFCLLFLLGIISLYGSAQKLKATAVPAPVRATFNTKYPNTNGKWEKEDGQYEVSFKKRNMERSLLISTDGKLLETETAMAVNALPKAAMDYITEHYKGMKIKDAAKIVKADGEVNYEAALKEKDVIFDAAGKFIKEAKD